MSPDLRPFSPSRRSRHVRPLVTRLCGPLFMDKSGPGPAIRLCQQGARPVARNVDRAFDFAAVAPPHRSNAIASPARAASTRVGKARLRFSSSLAARRRPTPPKNAAHETPPAARMEPGAGARLHCAVKLRSVRRPHPLGHPRLFTSRSARAAAGRRSAAAARAAGRSGRLG